MSTKPDPTFTGPADDPKSSVPNLAKILNKSNRRQNIVAQLRLLQERLELRLRGVVEALRRFQATLPGSSAYCVVHALPPERREPLADALLALCQAIREGKFDRGIKLNLEECGPDGGENNFLAGELYRLGWSGNRKGILDFLHQLDNLPERPDGFSHTAACQEGVWRAVAGCFGAIVPWPNMGTVHGWHPDAVEADQLQAELSERTPETKLDGAPGVDATNSSAGVSSPASVTERATINPEPATGIVKVTAPVADEEHGRNVFRMEGEVWTLSFADQTIRLKDSLGLKYIAQLLASKGRAIDAATLRSVATGNAFIKPLDGIELLDHQGILAYKAEYEDLTAQLEEAKEFNDVAKQEQIQRKLHWIAEAIEAARGFGGRPRRSKDERSIVRTSIKNAITRAIEGQIRKKHPDLARHLDTFIRTGQSLWYAPDPDLDWEL
jgi:hypothetical protein